MTVVTVLVDHRSNFIARRFAASRSGSAVIEFALIAPVFFLLIFSIMEIGIIFFAQETIQHSAEDVARMVRTGQVQGVLTQAQVKSRVCADVAPLIPCDNNLDVDVESFTNFGGVNFSNPLGGGNSYTPPNNFQTGTACSVVLVRVFYPWRVFTPVLTPFLSNVAQNRHLLYSAATFRNEPFVNGISGC